MSYIPSWVPNPYNAYQATSRFVTGLTNRRPAPQAPANTNHNLLHRPVLSNLLLHDIYTMQPPFPTPYLDRAHIRNMRAELMFREMGTWNLLCRGLKELGACTLYIILPTNWMTKSKRGNNQNQISQDKLKEAVKAAHAKMYANNTKHFISRSPAQRLKWLYKSYNKLSLTDNPKEILSRRLYLNLETVNNLTEALGDPARVRPFIIETLAEEFTQDMETVIGKDQCAEHPVTNMAHGAKRLAKETLDELDAELEDAAITIQRAYREYRSLHPNLPGAWKIRFDNPKQPKESPKS